MDIERISFWDGSEPLISVKYYQEIRGIIFFTSEFPDGQKVSIVPHPIFNETNGKAERR